MVVIKEMKPVTKDELKIVSSWIRLENWTSATLKELEKWHDLNPDSFLGAYDEQGELVGKYRRINSSMYILL